MQISFEVTEKLISAFVFPTQYNSVFRVVKIEMFQVKNCDIYVLDQK